jgi:hypothetical protein
VAVERGPAAPRFLIVFPREPAMSRAVIFLSALVFSFPAFAADDFAPMALNSLSAAPEIVSAPVMDRNGTIIGKVRAVATDQDGRPSAISYIAGNRLMVVAAPAVSYDAQKNLVVADTTKARPGRQAAAS